MYIWGLGEAVVHQLKKLSVVPPKPSKDHSKLPIATSRVCRELTWLLYGCAAVWHEEALQGINTGHSGLIRNH
jgi:hypothetical protein